MEDVKHGTIKGYWSHVLDNQQPCAECWETWASTHTDPPGTVYEPEWESHVVPHTLRPNSYRDNPRG